MEEDSKLSAPLLPSASNDDVGTVTTAGEGEEAAATGRGRPTVPSESIKKGVSSRRPSTALRRQSSATKVINSSVLTDYNQARADALPLTRAANQGTFLHYFRCADPDHDPQSSVRAKVSLWRLLSYSTWKERGLMMFGVAMATFSGLAIPLWLVLLAQSLDSLSNLASLIATVGNAAIMDVLMNKLRELCLAFAVVGFVSLVTGSLYVSIWTYTGEKMALRIQNQFVRASMNQVRCSLIFV